MTLKTTLTFALVLILAACSGEPAAAPDAEPTAVADSDDDTLDPVAAAPAADETHDENEAHDESKPHAH